MPWSYKDSLKHKKGLSLGRQKKWAKIANNVLKSCMKDVGDAGRCEGMAIRIANAKSVQSKRLK